MHIRFFNRKKVSGVAHMSAIPSRLVRQWLLVWLLPLLIVSPGHAEVVEDLYAVTVPVSDGEPYTRQLAFDEGLAQILIRVTGNSELFSVIKLPRSSPFVLQFQYSELDPAQKTKLMAAVASDIDGKKREFSKQLEVQYNETKVNDYLRKNAMPIWDKHRVKTVVWLAVNDGVNRYLLKSQDDSVLKSSTTEVARNRAVPIIWPSITTEEQSLRFADVWAGFKRPLEELSQKYSKGPILIGRLLWSGERWSSEWSLMLEGVDYNWNIENADHKRLLQQAVDTAANKMGEQFAFFDTGDMNTLHSLDIEIQNVKSIAALNRVKKYLSTVPSVQETALTRVDGQNVFFKIALRSNAEDFVSFIGTASMLILLPDEVVKQSKFKSIMQQEAADFNDDSVAYRFQLQH